ncbi:hypothetical protein [Sorangium sp. So ce1097]|uniref:hypothetical protein n=1 Tax=Sorangium sp. So ce1097 TaxID=3133330 RepID=UPI003F5D9FCD
MTTTRSSPSTRVTGWPCERLHVEVLGDDLYGGLHERLFQLDPANGAVERRWDLSALSGVPFFTELFDRRGFFCARGAVAR